MNVAQIIARNGFGFTLEGSQIVIGFMYNKFEPYKLMPVNIDDFYTRHLDNRGPHEPKPSMRQFPTDKAEYLDKLEEDCLTSWENMAERTAEREDAYREGVNECYRVANEKWNAKPSAEYLAELEEYEALLNDRRRMLPGHGVGSSNDFAAQGKKHD